MSLLILIFIDLVLAVIFRITVHFPIPIGVFMVFVLFFVIGGCTALALGNACVYGGIGERPVYLRGVVTL